MRHHHQNRRASRKYASLTLWQPPGSAPWNFSGRVRFEAHSELLKIPGIWDTISAIKHNITQFWWKELSLTRFYWFSKLNSDVQDSNWDLVWNMRSRAKFYPDSYVGSFYWYDFITTLKPLVTLKVNMSLSNVSVLKQSSEPDCQFQPMVVSLEKFIQTLHEKR